MALPFSKRVVWMSCKTTRQRLSAPTLLDLAARSALRAFSLQRWAPLSHFASCGLLDLTSQAPQSGCLLPLRWTWLLYWPCAWSIALAANPGSIPDVRMLALFGAGAFLMRGAGCIINDMWDRDFDKKVARTRERPLASGEIVFRSALVWLAGQLGLSLLILTQFNWFSIMLGASSLGIVLTYPLFKRFTYFPQLALGCAFNWGALLGYAAVRGYVDVFSVLPLYAAGICWTMVYDTIYAHQDKTDDALIGVKSTALRFGDETPKILWEFSTAMVFGLGLSGYMAGLSWPFFVGLVGVGGHLTYQTFSLKMDDPADCWEKFVSNHYLGFFVFLAIVAGNLRRSEETVKERKEIFHSIARNFSFSEQKPPS